MPHSIPPDRLGYKETVQIGDKQIAHYTQVSTPWAKFVKNLTHFATNNPLFRTIRTLWAKFFNKITPSKPEALANWRISVLSENYLVSTTPFKVALTFLQSKYPLSQQRIYHEFYGGAFIETPQSLNPPSEELPNEQARAVPHKKHRIDEDSRGVENRAKKRFKTDSGSAQSINFSSQEKKVRPTPELSFFPILLKRSLIPNHVICITYDNKNKRLEIYDSQGEDIKNLLDEILPNDRNQNITLRQMLQDIVSDNQFRLKDAEIKQIITNSNVHQKDSHNCSIHVLDYIKRRMEGQSAEQIFGSEKNIEEMEQLRKSIIEDITAYDVDPDFGYDNPSN